VEEEDVVIELMMHCALGYFCDAGLLDLSVNRSIEPALMFLRSLGIPKQQLHAMVSTQPKVLGMGVVEELEPVVSFMRSPGLTQEEAVALLAAHPWLFQLGLLGLLRYKETVDEFGMRWWEAGVLMQKVVGAGRGPNALAALVRFLQQEVGVSDRQLQAFGKFHPWVLAMAEEEVGVRVDFLRAQQLETEDISALIAIAPDSTLRSSEQELRARLNLLATLAKLGNWQTAGKLLRAHPQLVDSSVSKLRYLQRAFSSRGVNGENLIRLLVAQSNPMKWASDLLSLQLDGRAEGSGPPKSHPTAKAL
jgi:hypothetical protein